ncbi:unnamed protein product, partial [Rotaria sp. Silwood2]
YILNGGFSQLHTLYIDLTNIYLPEKEVQNQVKIPNLKVFFLSCVWRTSYYSELIMPLLYRMSNLEKFDLDLTIWADERFIDGEYS